MDIEIKQMQINEIRANPDNPRKIGKREMEQLIQSLQEFPDMLRLREIVVDETMTILGGNMRWRALKQSGVTECAVKIVHGLTPEQKREFVIKDNGTFGSWDLDALSSEWADLPLADWGVDLPDGWDDTPPGETDAEPQMDRGEELNKKWNVERGDLWQIGRHRLFCGDAADPDQAAHLMAGDKVDMVFTDPPYGVSYADKNEYYKNIGLRGHHIKTPIEGDHLKIEDLAESVIYPSFCRIKAILKDRSSYYITAPQGGDLLMMMMMMMMQKSGLILRHMIIWVKNIQTLGRCDYDYQHEPILYGWVKRHQFYGRGKHKTSTWAIKKYQVNDLHPTMKPVELVTNAIQNSCPPDGLVADLFGGSGTTMVAAENTRTQCRMMELTPGYCAVILQRMADAFPGIEIRRI